MQALHSPSECFDSLSHNYPLMPSLQASHKISFDTQQVKRDVRNADSGTFRLKQGGSQGCPATTSFRLGCCLCACSTSALGACSPVGRARGHLYHLEFVPQTGLLPSLGALPRASCSPFICCTFKFICSVRKPKVFLQ